MRWTNVQTCAGTVSDIQLVCWLAIAIAIAFAFAIAIAVATPTKQLAGGKATRMGGEWALRRQLEPAGSV